MIKIENIILPSPEQWEATIRGMRNPKNSWDRSDSEYDVEWFGDYYAVLLGEKDHKLMDSLNAGGPVHAKYRRMIPVDLDITDPLFFIARSKIFFYNRID